MDTSDIIPKDSIEFIQIKLPDVKQSKLMDGFDMSTSQHQKKFFNTI